MRHRLRVNAYEQKEQDDRVLLFIKGQNFGRFSKTKIYINGSELSQSYLLKWSDSEIQISVRKPFAFAMVQLKKGNQVSRYIPIWDSKYLPQVQTQAQYELQYQEHDVPVLESYQLITEHPPILEIRGQNLGFRYQNQWLLFHRTTSNRPSLYFDVSALANYRIIKISEIQHWNDSLIRLQVPQEVAKGPIFLVRLVEGKLQSSNSLYIPAAPNRKYQNVPNETGLTAGDANNSANADAQKTGGKAPATLQLRLTLHPQKELLLDPKLWPHTTQTQPSQKQQQAQHLSKETYSKLYRELLSERAKEQTQPNEAKQQTQSENRAEQVLPLPRLFRLRWPRNELGQHWHSPKPYSPSNPNQTDKREPSWIFPVHNFYLLPIPAKLIQDYQLAPASQLLKSLATTVPQRRLYLDLSYTAWQQAPAEGSRSQAYHAQELEQLRYQLHYNQALAANYRVPTWQFGRAIDKRLRPYAKALQAYRQAVRELDIQAGYLPKAGQPFVSWLYSPAEPQASLKQVLQVWPRQYLQSAPATSQEAEDGAAKQSSPEPNLLERMFISDDNPKGLAPEQILLLLLRTFTELELPARIVAGAIGHVSSQYATELQPYFWLEIYLPEFGWFQADLLAEILAYRHSGQNRNQDFDSNLFWGRIKPQAALQPSQVKLAFFALQDTWQQYDANLYQPLPNKHAPLFYWRIEALHP